MSDADSSTTGAQNTSRTHPNSGKKSVPLSNGTWASLTWVVESDSLTIVDDFDGPLATLTPSSLELADNTLEVLAAAMALLRDKAAYLHSRDNLGWLARWIEPHG